MPDTTREQLRATGQLADISQDDRHVQFAELIDNDGDYTRCCIGDPAEALAVLQYTGGTTGLPKGAMLTHANLTAACIQAWLQTFGETPVLNEGEERVLAVLSPFHIFALTCNMLWAVRAGAELIQHLRFDPKAVLADIQDKQITAFSSVPTMLTALVNDPDIGNYNLRSLKFCNSGGAPLPVEVGRRFGALTGVRVSEGWGLTEASPTGTFTPQHRPRKPGSCGIPSARLEIRMLDIDNPTRYVPLGQTGEICIRGPNVMKGYWKRPDATAEVTTFDGFVRTGDVGWMDEDGYMYLVDRTKDMLLCSGYNVYPRMLEEVIYRHPAVREVAVIGIPDEYRGQSPKAFVVLNEGSEPFTLEALQAFLKDKVGKHEMVHALAFVDELPKTPVGKISKMMLARQGRPGAAGVGG